MQDVLELELNPKKINLRNGNAMGSSEKTEKYLRGEKTGWNF